MREFIMRKFIFLFILLMGGIAFGQTLPQGTFYTSPMIPHAGGPMIGIQGPMISGGGLMIPNISGGGIAPTVYAGPGDVVATGPITWYGLRAYNLAAAMAGQKAVHVCSQGGVHCSDFSADTSGNLVFTQLDDGTVCGLENCFIYTWYDQSGANACSGPCDLVQLGNPPILQPNCIAKSLPCARYPTGTAHQMQTAGSLTAPSTGSGYTYAAYAGVGGTIGAPDFSFEMLGCTASGDTNSGFNNALSADDVYVYAGAAPYYQVPVTTGPNVLHSIVGVANGAASFIILDGTVNGPGTATQGPDCQFSNLNSSGEDPGHDGYIAEIGWWTTKFNSTQYAAMAANQAAFYNPVLGALPSFAAANGYTNRVFMDPMTSCATVDSTNSLAPGFNWYLRNAWAAGSIVSPATLYTGNISCGANGLTMNQGGDVGEMAINSAAQSSGGTGTQHVGTTFNGGWYVRVTYYTDPTLAISNPQAWPIVWAVPLEVYGVVFPNNWVEQDHLEYISSGVGTVATQTNQHDWGPVALPNCSVPVCDQDVQIVYGGPTPPIGPHILERAWVPIAKGAGTGTVTTKIDGTVVATLHYTATTGATPAAVCVTGTCNPANYNGIYSESDNMNYFYKLGAGCASTVQATCQSGLGANWPMTFYDFEIWQ